VPTSNALTLRERLDSKLEASPRQLARANVNLAEEWHTEKYLQKPEAMLIVSDDKDFFVITGAGDVLTPKHDSAAMESGGNYALASGRARTLPQLTNPLSFSKDSTRFSSSSAC
jgi:ATP-dependent HslUV protease subunit HslV